MIRKTCRNRHRTWVALLPCAIVSLGCFASAADASDVSHDPLARTVSFAGLKLSRESDVKLLYGRIHAAAELVCAPLAIGGPIEATLRSQRCIRESVARAIADVNAPALTRYYAALTAKLHATPQLSSR